VVTQRLPPSQFHSLLEIDLNDQYHNISIKMVYRGLFTLIRKLKKRLKKTNNDHLFWSISKKGGDAVRGKKPNRYFHVFSEYHLYEWAKFDLFQNNLVRWADKVKQQIVGIPMGGFTSAAWADIALFPLECDIRRLHTSKLAPASFSPYESIIWTRYRDNILCAIPTSLSSTPNLYDTIKSWFESLYNMPAKIEHQGKIITALGLQLSTPELFTSVWWKSWESVVIRDSNMFLRISSPKTLQFSLHKQFIKLMFRCRIFAHPLLICSPSELLISLWHIGLALHDVHFSSSSIFRQGLNTLKAFFRRFFPEQSPLQCLTLWRTLCGKLLRILV
jgi:hypothetical protein